MNKMIVCCLIAMALTGCGMSTKEKLALQIEENKRLRLELEKQREISEEQRRSLLTPEQRQIEDENRKIELMLWGPIVIFPPEMIK